MQKQLKSIPKFHNEDEERKFWAENDSVAYINWAKAKKIRFLHLKPTTKSISLRLPVALLERIKIAANQQDIPYQSYLKMILHKGIVKEKESI